MPDNQVSIEDFASRIKKAAPELASVPDDVLVRKVLDRRPQLAAVLTKQPGQVPVPGELTKPDSLGTKVMDQIGQGVESTMDLPKRLMNRGRELFQQAPNVQGKLMAPLKAENEEVTNALRGIYQSSAPGMIGKPPENKIANATMMMAGAGEGGEPARGVAEAATKPASVMREVVRTTKGEGGPSAVPDPTKAGSLIGSHSRAVDTMNRVDRFAHGIPVDYKPAYEWAQKAMDLGKRGFTVPKPITDFVKWVEAGTQSGNLMGLLDEPGAKVDQPASLNPLEYQHARDFEVALGSKIPWELDSGGKMAGIMKKMRQSLGDSTAQALKPYGLDTPYLRAKADFTKAYGAEKMWGPFGKFGGKLAGYGVGMTTGHPLILGYGGGVAGEKLAGSLVRSVTGEDK